MRDRRFERSGGFFWFKFAGMESTIIHLQNTLGESGVSNQDYQDLLDSLEGIDSSWFEFDEVEQLYYLTPEILAYTKSASEDFEALGLGELEERIVEVLEEGKNIKWGKLALAMWLFFLFIVVYTIIETVYK